MDKEWGEAYVTWSHRRAAVMISQRKTLPARPGGACCSAAAIQTANTSSVILRGCAVHS